MIFPIVRTAFVALRRDRGALALSFVLPIAFFSIFAVIFGRSDRSTPKITIIAADEDHSAVSQRLLKGLQAETSLYVLRRPAPKQGVEQPEYTTATAEAAVKDGVAPLALIVPKGFGDSPISFGGGDKSSAIRLLKDRSDMVAAPMVAGLLQKTAMTSMPDLMAEQGSKYMDRFTGGFTPEQRQRIDQGMAALRQQQQSGAGNASNGNSGGLLAVTTTDVVGANKVNPMVSFYAAAIGVMFLLFTASGTAGSLLDEAENGTLDRVLSSRVTMTTMLGGKLTFSTILAFTQLVLMFLWAWLVFKLDFFSHIPGFLVMGLSTAFAVGAFGMVLASICQTRAQLGALSTLVILVMSSVGGSMFPRFLMPEAMQKAGLLTINAWAIDGFTKVFWRDLPVSALWPQVSVLLTAGVVLFLVARKLAHRWETS